MNQQVIINLKVVPRGFTVVESSVDAPTIISLPKNLVYGTQQPPHSAPAIRQSRGRNPHQRTIQGLQQDLERTNDHQHHPILPQQRLPPQQQAVNYNPTLKRRPEAPQPQAQQQPQVQEAPPQVKNLQVNKVNNTIKSKEYFLKQFDRFIPATSRWFKMDSIHQIEKDALPEFFQETYSVPEGKSSFAFKNPSLYMHYRNTIVQKFQKNPRSHLKILECLQTMQGDISAIMRVYAFLEHWGLINYNLQPQHMTAQAHYFQLNKGYWERIKVNFNNDYPNNITKMKDIRCQLCDVICESEYFKQKEDYKPEFQDALMQICVNCYDQKAFPQFLKQDDFFPVAVGTGSSSVQNWPNEDTLRLLECIHKYSENWSEIRKHLPQYTLEQIIKHYLSLPFKSISHVMFIDEIEHEKSVTKQEISFVNDTASALQQYLPAFKILLDRFDHPKTKTEAKIEHKVETQAPLQQMVEVQISKIDQTLQFLEEFERNVCLEKLQLNIYQRQNVALSLEGL